MDGFLFQAFVYLLAGVIAAPLAQRFGLGSVLGYLLAGILIGPVLQLVGDETQDLQHFAEFGVVMMLFIVGLELEPRLLWNMRWRLLGMGGLQLLLTVALAALIGKALGVSWTMALAAGMIFSVSSTAIVLQTLSEKKLSDTDGGRASFSVLLFQDIAVIPMLAILPLMAAPELMEAAASAIAGEAPGVDAHNGAHGENHGDNHGGGDSLMTSLPPWGQALVVLGSIASVILGGHYLSRPVFRFIAQSRLREVFSAAALLLVVGIALLMTLAGLSPALGAFLAGVVLANSEFRHELQADIDPFKGLLLGLFFMTVGAGVDFSVLARDAGLIVSLTLGVMALKGAVLYAIAQLYRLKTRDALLLALGLAQAGEFGFVLISFSLQNFVFSAEAAQLLSLVVALSMMLTPPLFIFYDRVIARGRNTDGADRAADAIDSQGPAIIAGLGRFGQIVNRMLLTKGVRTVVLDHRAELVDGLRRFGMRSFYGDATRPDLLRAAGLMDASVLVVALDDKQQAVELVTYARRERPDLHIIARAIDRQHVYALDRAGANDIVRELFESSMRAAKHALTALGHHPYEVEKHARAFAAFDRETLNRMAAVWDPSVSVWDNAAYITLVRERNALQEQALTGARSTLDDRSERGWTPPPKGYADTLGADAEPLAGADDAPDAGEPAAKPVG